MVSPWGHKSCQQMRSGVGSSFHRVLPGWAPAQASHRVTASLRCLHLLQHGILHGLQHRTQQPSLLPQQQKMNWVGGSRSRIILKQERRKQKEFFEKKKLKSKMKLLGVSSPKSSAVSLDLLNLYVVNQISTKKENTENVRKPVHIDITEDVKIPVRRHNIELPESPLRTQHVSNLDDIQNSLDYTNSDRKNPVLTTSNDLENSEGIEEPLFAVVKETAGLKAPQVGSDCSFLALFEDESKLIHNNPSTKHYNPFVNQSSSAIFFMDPDDRNQMTNRNYPYDTREAYHAVIAKPRSADRHLEGIFTAPEQVLRKSNNSSSASYKKTSGLYKTHLQDYHEGQHYFMPSENKEKPSDLEESGTFAYHCDQWINLKENVPNCSRKKSDDESVKESGCKQNQLFGFEEKFTTAQEKKFGVSSNLHTVEKDVESSLSSQSPSNSPRQTESCFSSSPDTSEEEDIARKKEYLNKLSLKTHDANLVSASGSTELLRTSHTRTMPHQPPSILPRDEANHLCEKNPISCVTEEENKDPAAPSEGSSSHQALEGEHVAPSTRCDGWSQTESSLTGVKKVDVATQCGLMPVCSCGSSLPSAQSPGGFPLLCTVGTDGGHKMPAQEAMQPAGTGSAAGIAVSSSEGEYLSLAGRRTLEVLNYIDIMKEREKQ
ncbi:regulator of DNA class I crossover intermediates 1 [Porphyrio hochstetteri]